MKKRLIFLWFLFSMFNAVSQSTVTSSDSLLKESKSYRDQGDYQQALNYAQLAYDKAKEEENFYLMGNSLIQIGHNRRFTGQYNEGFKTYREALEIFLDLPDNNKRKERLASVYNNLSAVCEQLARYEDGVRFAKSAIQYSFLDTANFIITASAYNNMANNFAKWELQDSAIVANENAVAVLQSINFPDSTKNCLADAYLGLGNRYGYLDQYEKSNEYYEEVLKIYEELENIYDAATLYEVIGVNEMDSKQYNQAEKNFKESEKLLKSIKGTNDDLSHLYYNWSLLKRNTGNIRQALNYSNYALFNSKDSQLGFNFKRELDSNHDLLTTLLKKNNLSWIFSLAVSLLLTILVLIWRFEEKKASRLKAELDKQEKTFSFVKHDLIKNLAVAVRNNLTTHTLQNQINLSEVLINLDMLIKIAKMPPEKAAALKDFGASEKLDLKDFGASEKLNLKDFIEKMYWFAQQTSKIKNIVPPYYEDFEETAHFFVKPSVQKTILFSVIANAFDNIREHSKAKNVSLNVIAEDRGKLKIIISDDGKGFSEEEIHEEGEGLRNLRNSVREIGGTTNIESTPGKGTTIRIVIKKPFES